MDAEELLEKWKKDSSQVNFAELKRLFFNQKIVAFLEGNKYEPRYWKYEEKKMDDFIANIRQELPEAELVCDKSNKRLFLSMKNVDFELTNFGIRIYDRSISFPDKYASYDMANLLQKFDNAMAEWETEFRLFCTENQQTIENCEKKRLAEHSGKMRVLSDYLECMVMNTALMYRQLLPHMCESVVNALKKHEIESIFSTLQFNYCKFDFKTNVTENVRLDFNHGRSCYVGLHSADFYLEIDRRIPQWIEEGKELEREFDKREKIQQINENTIKVLVKNKMHELNFEYRLNQKEQYHYQQSAKPIEYVLEVKLQKGRKLVVTIPPDNIDRVRKILDSIETSINAINSVPMNHRIKFQNVGNEAWTKE